MNIYLDTCCYGRPYDDPAQVKIAVETAAIKGIIDICRVAGHCIVGSTAVDYELGNISNAKKRDDIETFFNRTKNTYYVITADIDIRAQALQTDGLGRLDSYHLAIAEAAGVDVLLTTDEPFVRICARKNLSSVRVINPLNFLQEVIN
jgi:predicted nucleic acid-binding protein